MAEALCIALVGAESTGKTALARALAQELAADTGRRVAWVPEVLRDWCDANGRTPRQHEQAGILRSQHTHIDAAAALHDIVVCDTTALMTTVYSRIVFGDRTLDGEAARLHRTRIGLTLLTALDLPWVADGLQREGPQVREPVDTMLRELMAEHAIDHAVVSGHGPARLQHALAAVAPLLRTPPAAPSPGLFTAGPRGWACECCDPASERALMRRR